jgi:Transposase
MKIQPGKKVQQDKKQRTQASSKPTASKWEEMNRKQRREMMRKMQSKDLSLEVVHPHAAGIDIGNASHYVAVPPSRDPQPVRCFGCTTAELKKMAEWLTQCRIRTVALQSTGVYWMAVYDILEEAGLEVYLVNARETKNLPGRKTDVQESQWLMKLHTYGLLRNSFRRRRRFAPCGHTGDSARIWYAVSVVIFSGCRRY